MQIYKIQFFPINFTNHKFQNPFDINKIYRNFKIYEFL